MPEVSGHIHDNNRNIVSITPVGNMRPEKQRPPKQTVQAPPAHADQALQTTKHQSQTNAHPTHRVLIAAPHQVLTPPTHQPQTPPNPPARSLVSALCSIPKAPPMKRTRKCESATVIRPTAQKNKEGDAVPSTSGTVITAKPTGRKIAANKSSRIQKKSKKPIADESSDDEDWSCLVCGEPYRNSKPRGGSRPGHPGHVTRSYFSIHKNDIRSYYLDVQDFTFPSYLRPCNLYVSVISMSMNTDHDIHVDGRYIIT